MIIVLNKYSQESFQHLLDENENDTNNANAIASNTANTGHQENLSNTELELNGTTTKDNTLNNTRV